MTRIGSRRIFEVKEAMQGEMGLCVAVVVVVGIRKEFA